MSARPQKITFAEMRFSGVHGLLVYCAHYCSHYVAPNGPRGRQSGGADGGIWLFRRKEDCRMEPRDWPPVGLLASGEDAHSRQQP